MRDTIHNRSYMSKCKHIYNLYFKKTITQHICAHIHKHKHSEINDQRVIQQQNSKPFEVTEK